MLSYIYWVLSFDWLIWPSFYQKKKAKMSKRVEIIHLKINIRQDCEWRLTRDGTFRRMKIRRIRELIDSNMGPFSPVTHARDQFSKYFLQ